MSEESIYHLTCDGCGKFIGHMGEVEPWLGLRGGQDELFLTVDGKTVMHGDLHFCSPQCLLSFLHKIGGGEKE